MLLTSRRSLVTLAALALLMLVAAACTSTVTGVSSGDRAALAEAHARWQRSGIDDYDWIYQRGSCECLPEWVRPMYVEVRDGDAVTVVDAETREPFRTLALSTPPTVDQLFAVIAEALAQDAHSVRVVYDAVYGYPRMVDIDYHADYVDDELHVETREFTRR